MKRILCAILAMMCFGLMMNIPVVADVECNTALLSYVAGDIDGDWAVSTSDVRDMLASIVSDGAYKKSADINLDGIMNTADVSIVLKSVINNSDPVFVKPGVSQSESVPTGETVAFSFVVNGDKYAELGKSINDVWIAQSLDELRACYTYSYGRADYSEAYTDAFFEDRAVIVWDVYCMDYGLVSAQPGQIVKNGTDLCLVTNLVYTSIDLMPFVEIKRYIVEVSKEDIQGVDTISMCTEILWK